MSGAETWPWPRSGSSETRHRRDVNHDVGAQVVKIMAAGRLTRATSMSILNAMSDGVIVALVFGAPALGGLVVGLGGWRWTIALAVSGAVGFAALVAILSAADDEYASGVGLLLVPAIALGFAGYGIGLGLRYAGLSGLHAAGRAKDATVVRPAGEKAPARRLPPTTSRRVLAWIALVVLFPLSLVLLAMPGFRHTLG
jgi:hypothetical protein